MESGFDGARGLPRTQHRAGCDGILQHRRIHHPARRAAGPFGQSLAQAPDLAGVLDQSETRAHRRHATDRHIGRRCHRKTGGGKAQHQVIGVLAHDEVLAFAHNIPDVAEHKEVAGNGAGQASDIVGISGHEPIGEALGKMGRGIFLLYGIAHPLR